MPCPPATGTAVHHGDHTEPAVLLLGWSFLEGVGAALILPAIVALVAGDFAERKRPAAYGPVAAAGAIAITLGPLIGTSSGAACRRWWSAQWC